ncbi:MULTISPECIES: sigma-70 family RNA polymerase sigma factor [unclassified Pseudoalteromonas]|uniref:sigma-70 family RNA polymerase sigma factor n=1 Tax=unclassified Pseudoalteromonas TaxID=194690 RepID=UPI0025B34FD1|nr:MULTISPECIES: sigma-70 family RNA polymerase sigma factor [unclassified Pseudoalteromonas]MDN3380582.1 sigma-70 family RNA polymerase sigma factor [Pseudoalteromonas sp. APC 3893]MDN3388882.1 sigma-70 family RNA polymerase sigma factor [Pseudoalteromonas sp. APC 4017]
MTSQTANSVGFNRLYQEHHEWLVRWIARRTYNRDNAQDIAQDTFIRLLNKPAVYHEIRSPRAWLTKVAGNLVTDDIRRKILEENYVAYLESMPETAYFSPEEQFQLLKLLEQIDSLLSSLRSIEKKAFLMVRLDGLSYKEVASQLGVSLSSIEKYIAKAMFECYTLTYSDLE